jgi:hypothetical protein
MDEEGRQASPIRVLKAPRNLDVDQAAKKEDLAHVSQSLIDGDPEIDFENTGRFLRETSRVFVDPEGKVVHRVQRWEIIRNPDGTERSRQIKPVVVPNLTGEVPLKWSGVFMMKTLARPGNALAACLQVERRSIRLKPASRWT